MEGVVAMKEIWVPIDGYEGRYEVSNNGRVRSFPMEIKTYGNRSFVRNGRILKSSKSKGSKGYVHLSLYLNGIHKSYKVHRLVASAFIPNPKNLPQVNHKDGIKHNNFVDNLEWCDNNYNQRHRSKKVIQKKDGKIIKIWNSATEAELLNGFNKGCILACCRGERITHRGFKWTNK